MLEAVLRHLKNWFRVPGGIHHGTFVVEGGSITLPFLSDGQYYRVIGSVFNDGLHKYGNNEQMKPETFQGTIWELAIPPEIVAISEEIGDWNSKNAAKVNSPFQSESFENYSYTKATGQNGGAMGWESAFCSRLNPWRKVREV